MNLAGLARRLRIDLYIVAILLMVVVASLLPARGAAAVGFDWLTKVVIAILFFLHGARLSREAVIAGLGHWRLHLLVLASTFVLFPALGFAATFLPPAILPTALASGVLFLCCLPSTVQSSIAFTSVGRGNVAAAVVAASASNLFGIVLTPLIAGLLMKAHGGGLSLNAVWGVVVQLLLPFAAGQLSRVWLAAWAERSKKLLALFDRGTILLVVYSAFSEAVVQGIWAKVSALDLGKLLVLCTLLLVVLLIATAWSARMLGFSKADEVAIVFCGSKKSLASGVPMAGILFPAATVGVMILPLMLFHQIQLMACAVIAQRYGDRAPDPLLATAAAE